MAAWWVNSADTDLLLSPETPILLSPLRRRRRCCPSYSVNLNTDTVDVDVDVDGDLRIIFLYCRIPPPVLCIAGLHKQKIKLN